MVQGNQSVNSIVKGIEYLDEYIDNDGKCIDLILITRGGGSFEDLISYSSEEVVEAIHKCSKFTISAVGHEIDFMLSDFVADMRAPTPSISAEIICKSQNQYVEDFKTIKHKITTLMALQIKSKLESHMNQLQLIKHQLEDSLNSNNKILENEKLINLIRSEIYNKMKKKINLLNHDLVFIKRELDKYDIIGHMDNGYAVIFKKYSIIDSVDNIKIGQKLKIKMKDGELNVIVV
jgi:exodeoxyribonuclease VII large subunit